MLVPFWELSAGLEETLYQFIFEAELARDFYDGLIAITLEMKAVWLALGVIEIEALVGRVLEIYEDLRAIDFVDTHIEGPHSQGSAHDDHEVAVVIHFAAPHVICELVRQAITEEHNLRLYRASAATSHDHASCNVLLKRLTVRVGSALGTTGALIGTVCLYNQVLVHRRETLEIVHVLREVPGHDTLISEHGTKMVRQSRPILLDVEILFGQLVEGLWMFDEVVHREDGHRRR